MALSYAGVDVGECELFEDYHVEWAEPGKTVLFSRAVNGLTNIWKYSLQDRSLTQITFGTGPDFSPMQDPGGKGIYYVNGKSSGALAVYHVQSKELIDVVSEDATQPAISPDGKRLMYIRLPAPQRSELWVADIDGRNKLKLATGVSLYSGNWASDNFHLSFFEGTDENDKGYIIGADGSGLRQLPQMGPIGAIVWGLDQKSLYMSVKEKRAIIPTQIVWKVNTDGSKTETLVDNCGTPSNIDPAGQYLLSLGDTTGIYEISIAEVHPADSRCSDERCDFCCRRQVVSVRSWVARRSHDLRSAVERRKADGGAPSRV